MFYEPLSRSETVKFRVTLNREGVERHAEALRVLGFKYLVDSIQEGDTGHADYSINIQYFGDVVTKLRLFSSLLDDHRLVTEADFQELNHGKSIICGLVQQLTQIQDKLALRRFIDGTGGGALATGDEPEDEPEPELPVITVVDRSGWWDQLRDWWATGSTGGSHTNTDAP